MDFYYYSCLTEEILDMKKPQDLSDLGRPCGYLVFKTLKFSVQPSETRSQSTELSCLFNF